MRYVYGLTTAIVLMAFVQLRTNTTPPRWDATYYVNMAEQGIVGNPRLVVPFAYRPGMPYLSRVVSRIFSIPIESGFRAVTWAFGVCLLIAVYTLAFEFTKSSLQAILVMIIVGLSAMHIKFPLFFYTLVDISGYALIVIAFWSLMTGRLALCVVVSTVGLFFKEFLAIPLILACADLAGRFLHCRTASRLLHLAVAISLGAMVVTIPRILLPVSASAQYLDRFEGSSLIRQLARPWLDSGRLINLVLALMIYWLPALILLTPSRFRNVRRDLKGRTLHIALGHSGLTLLFAIYGGTNLLVFVSYLVPVQTVILALLFRYGVPALETIYVMAAAMIFNKILLKVPLPAENLEGYLDFYGAWSSRLDIHTLERLLNFCALLVLPAVLRVVGAFSSGSPRPANAG